MTASTTTTARAAASFPVASPARFGVLQVAYGTHTFAATDDEAGDVFLMCKIPAGATIIGGYVRGKDLDTGTEALDIDVGWIANGVESADPDGLGNLGLWSGDAATDVRPEVGIYYNFGGVLMTAGPQTFTKETTIALTVNTPANVLGGGLVTVVVLFVCN